MDKTAGDWDDEVWIKRLETGIGRDDEVWIKRLETGMRGGGRDKTAGNWDAGTTRCG